MAGFRRNFKPTFEEKMNKQLFAYSSICEDLKNKKCSSCVYWNIKDKAISGISTSYSIYCSLKKCDISGENSCEFYSQNLPVKKIILQSMMQTIEDEIKLIK